MLSILKLKIEDQPKEKGLYLKVNMSIWLSHGGENAAGEMGYMVPELKGTTEENGEYGRASSTERTRGTRLVDPFMGDAPFIPGTLPFGP